LNLGGRRPTPDSTCCATPAPHAIWGVRVAKLTTAQLRRPSPLRETCVHFPTHAAVAVRVRADERRGVRRAIVFPGLRLQHPRPRLGVVKDEVAGGWLHLDAEPRGAEFEVAKAGERGRQVQAARVGKRARDGVVCAGVDAEGPLPAGSRGEAAVQQRRRALGPGGRWPAVAHDTRKHACSVLGLPHIVKKAGVEVLVHRHRLPQKVGEGWPGFHPADIPLPNVDVES